MVSPHLTKHKMKPDRDARRAQTFQTVYREENQEVKESESEAKIKVSALIPKLLFIMKKSALCGLQRRAFASQKRGRQNFKTPARYEGAIKLTNSEETARNLLTELIRAGYLPNDKIPETKIAK